MWLGCVSLVGRVHSSAASVFLSLHLVLWSQADGIPDLLTDPWDGTFSPLQCSSERPSGTQDALVTVLQVLSTHCVQGPPGAGEAMGSLVHGEILVWTWVSLTGTSSRSPHLPVLVSVQPEQLCLAAAGPA